MPARWECSGDMRYGGGYEFGTERRKHQGDWKKMLYKEEDLGNGQWRQTWGMYRWDCINITHDFEGPYTREVDSPMHPVLIEALREKVENDRAAAERARREARREAELEAERVILRRDVWPQMRAMSLVFWNRTDKFVKDLETLGKELMDKVKSIVDIGHGIMYNWKGEKIEIVLAEIGEINTIVDKIMSQYVGLTLEMLHSKAVRPVEDCPNGVSTKIYVQKECGGFKDCSHMMFRMSFPLLDLVREYREEILKIKNAPTPLHMMSVLTGGGPQVYDRIGKFWILRDGQGENERQWHEEALNSTSAECSPQLPFAYRSYFILDIIGQKDGCKNLSLEARQGKISPEGRQAVNFVESAFKIETTMGYDSKGMSLEDTRHCFDKIGPFVAEKYKIMEEKIELGIFGKMYVDLKLFNSHWLKNSKNEKILSDISFFNGQNPEDWEKNAIARNYALVVEEKLRIERKDVPAVDYQRIALGRKAKIVGFFRDNYVRACIEAAGQRVDANKIRACLALFTAKLNYEHRRDINSIHRMYYMTPDIVAQTIREQYAVNGITIKEAALDKLNKYSGSYGFFDNRYYKVYRTSVLGALGSGACWNLAAGAVEIRNSGFSERLSDKNSCLGLGDFNLPSLDQAMSPQK